MENSMSKTKEVSKKTPEAPEAPMQLCNEQQETIFDNDLTIAASDYAKAVKEEKLWKDRKSKCKSELINQMKVKGHKTMRMGEDKVIQYKFVDAKEDIILKDYKARTPRKRRY